MIQRELVVVALPEVGLHQAQPGMAVLLGKEFGLGGGSCGGFAAGDADDAENGERRDGRAGDEDAVCV